MRFEDKTIFGIEHNEDGERQIHIFGYGYYSGAENEKGKPYRFLEYTWLIGTLKEVEDAGGFDAFEENGGEECKQYLTDCSEKELIHIYQHYDNGKCPTLIHEHEIATAPEGIYILVRD